MVLNMPEYTMGSEYVLIYMNMSNCARILNMSESAEIYPNVGKYASRCSNVMNNIMLERQPAEVSRESKYA